MQLLFSLSLLDRAHADFSLAFSHGLQFTIPPPKTVSVQPPPFSHTHKVYSNLKYSKDSPCVLQAVSPPFSFPPPPRSQECLDRSKWCDCDCSAGRLPLSVFGKSDVSRGREERGKNLSEGEGEGESSFEQQGMAALQRTKSSVRSRSPLQPVLLHVFNPLILSHCPLRTSHLQHCIRFLPLNQTPSFFFSLYLPTRPLFTLPVRPNLWGGGGVQKRRDL